MAEQVEPSEVSCWRADSLGGVDAVTRHVEFAEITEQARALAAAGITHDTLNLDDLPLGHLADVFADIDRELRERSGIVIVDGFPVDDPLVDAATQTWNETLDSLNGRDDEELHVAVLYSNYRLYAMLLVRDPSSTSSPSSTDLPPRWLPLYANDRHDMSTLEALHFSDEPAIALGAAHLSCLMAGSRI